MYQPEIILERVRRSLGTLSDLADDLHGLFPSIVDLDTLSMPDDLPPNIPGQRNEDRAHPGSNLMHDKYTLATMYELARSVEPEYARFADRYLQRFAVHCTNTATGLFPWGEHAFWDVKHDRIGNSFPLAYDWWTNPAIHDHLSAAPFWLWEKLHRFNPRSVERFAEGLDYHWRDGEPLEYCRHANIEICERPPREARSCDFPRHGGFYIMDWTFAYLKTEREDFLRQICKMLDYWWEKRDPATAMLPLESKTPPEITAIYGLTSPGQAMSLAMSLFETAEFIKRSLSKSRPADESDEAYECLCAERRWRLEKMAQTMWDRALAYANSFLMLPHDPDKRIWVSCTRFDTGEIAGTMKCWGSVYGSGVAAGTAKLCIGFYRMTGDEKFLQFARYVAEDYETQPFPRKDVVPVSDAGTVIGLFADLYDVTREKAWLEAGLRTASELIDVYFDRDLPRGEAHVNFYESQMGPGILLQSLAQIALLASDPVKYSIEPDYSAR